MGRGREAFMHNLQGVENTKLQSEVSIGGPLRIWHWNIAVEKCQAKTKPKKSRNIRISLALHFPPYRWRNEWISRSHFLFKFNYIPTEIRFFPFVIQAAHKPSWTSHQKPPSFFCSQGSAKYLSVFGKVPQTSRTLFFAQCERPLQCERCVSMSFIFDNAHFWGLLGPRLSGLANSNVARSTFWKGKIINAFGA